MKKYKVVRGINWPGPTGESRAEPGQTLTEEDLAGGNVKWFLKVGAIREIKPRKKTKTGGEA